MQKGGGTWVVDLPLLATKEVIVGTGISCFFPNGSSTFGSSDQMEFLISNFQQQEISDDDGFILQNYIEQNLQPLSTTPWSSDSDCDLEKPVFETGTAHQKNQPKVSTEVLAERQQLAV